jgi:hypothetical protein
VGLLFPQVRLLGQKKDDPLINMRIFRRTAPTTLGRIVANECVVSGILINESESPLTKSDHPRQVEQQSYALMSGINLDQVAGLWQPAFTKDGCRCETAPSVK